MLPWPCSNGVLDVAVAIANSYREEDPGRAMWQSSNWMAREDQSNVVEK